MLYFCGKKQSDMEKIILLISFCFCMQFADAQQVTVAEPEYVNSYWVLTSDKTCEELPKESGAFAQHENKVSKISKWARKASGVANTVGIFGVLGGSTSSIQTGAEVLQTSSKVSTAADVANGLAGAMGMDVAFSGAHSSYLVTPDGKDMRILVKHDSNENDPLDVYRIVRFSSKKKERRFRLLDYDVSLLCSQEARKEGYLPFSGSRYGNQSYILTIPAKKKKKGDYGIIYLSTAVAAVVPVATFTIK